VIDNHEGAKGKGVSGSEVGRWTFSLGEGKGGELKVLEESCCKDGLGKWEEGKGGAEEVGRCLWEGGDQRVATYRERRPDAGAGDKQRPRGRRKDGEKEREAKNSGEGDEK